MTYETDSLREIMAARRYRVLLRMPTGGWAHYDSMHELQKATGIRVRHKQRAEAIDLAGGLLMPIGALTCVIWTQGRSLRLERIK